MTIGSVNWSAYYRLAKPGIIYGNSLSVAGGFLLGARGIVDVVGLVAVLLGSALIIGAACVFNNYIDRDLDGHMARTKQRALVTGVIKPTHALVYGSVMCFCGFVLLIQFTNLLTVLLGAAGVFLYLAAYGIGKRQSEHGTLIGSLSGAIPPIAGYAAATNRVDIIMIFLFLILVFWQMPHFYAIAMYRSDDYRRAKLPVLPVSKGFAATKRQMIVYGYLYVFATLGLWLVGRLSLSYLLIMVLLGLKWVSVLAQNTRSGNVAWARQVFGLSLFSLTVFCLMISLDAWLV